jgi:bifunctional non-homologous end joining protein LigD
MWDAGPRVHNLPGALSLPALVRYLRLDMLSRPRTLPPGFIPPCLPTKAPRPPSGAMWLHEIKHDGFRVIARKDGARVKLYSRPGNDLTWRFSLIVESLGRLRSRSCIIDGEAVACDDNGVSSFDRIRHRDHDDCVFLYAFDLIELNGDDLRRDPLVVRKATLTSVIRLNEHMEFDDGETVFRHTCSSVSKALFRSGRTRPIVRAHLRTGSR